MPGEVKGHRRGTERGHGVPDGDGDRRDGALGAQWADGIVLGCLVRILALRRPEGLKGPQVCQDWLEKWEIRVNMA